MIKSLNIVPMFSFFYGLIKRKSFFSIGNVAAAFSLNLYFEKYWTPIILIITTLFFFSTCMFLFYRYKNKKDENANFSQSLHKSQEIFRTVLLSLLIFVTPYLYKVYAEQKRIDKMTIINEKWENEISIIQSIARKFNNGELKIRKDQIDNMKVPYLNAFALYCCHGDGGTDYKKGFECFTLAANKGDAFAWSQLAVMYANGNNSVVNKRKSMVCLKKAADLGYAESMYKVGLGYSRGIGSEKKIDLAFEYLTNAALCGNVDAMIELGNLYSLNEKENQWKNWYKKAAKKGKSDSYVIVASFFIDEKKYEKAKELALKSINEGIYGGYAILAELYEKGCGVKRNLKRAEILYKEFVNQSDSSSNAIRRLAAYYKDNGDLPKYEWWMKEAQKKDSLNGMIVVERKKGIRNDIEIVKYKTTNHNENK
jgi:TPR repeat protein